MFEIGDEILFVHQEGSIKSLKHGYIKRVTNNYGYSEYEVSYKGRFNPLIRIDDTEIWNLHGKIRWRELAHMLKSFTEEEAL